MMCISSLRSIVLIVGRLEDGAVCHDHVDNVMSTNSAVTLVIFLLN
jgi:hypothetical protein